MNSQVDQNVAAEIRAQLARQRVTGRQLATKLGVSHTWVNRRTSGETPATVADLHRIADALGISPDVLVRAGTPAA